MITVSAKDIRNFRKHTSVEAYIALGEAPFVDLIQNRFYGRTLSVQDGINARELATKLARKFFSGKSKKLTGTKYSEAYGQVVKTKIGLDAAKHLGDLLKASHRGVTTLALPDKELIYGVYASSDPQPKRRSSLAAISNRRIAADNDNSLVVEVPVSHSATKPEAGFKLARIRLNLTQFIRELLDEANPRTLQNLRSFLMKAGFSLEQIPQSQAIAGQTHPVKAEKQTAS